MTVPNPEGLEKKANKHKSSQAHIPTFGVFLESIAGLTCSPNDSDTERRSLDSSRDIPRAGHMETPALTPRN